MNYGFYLKLEDNGIYPQLGFLPSKNAPDKRRRCKYRLDQYRTGTRATPEQLTTFSAENMTGRRRIDSPSVW